ncbi:oligosaccharide flippase family protein [Asticcacaulis tiandongensis]|uniref:oligosaccharide flippase family protein n=1 Tax=Asticcacaulis tiandongensis TaxID=2565365 RepID=UPI00112901B9|nr:oligosaccharide flippase family protein [Asticcacaulis tiandongensis]
MTPEPSPSRKTLQAGLWTVGARLGAKIIDFLALLLLARFLGPADFGLVAMAMTAVFIVEAILELPLSAALVRINEPTRRMFHTAFTLGILRGLAIAALLGGLAVPMAHLYSEDKLIPLVCALAFAPILRGLFSPRMVIFAKRMDFRREAIMELTGKIMALSAAIWIAVATESYWAIVIATVGGPAVMLILSYMMAPMRPGFTLKDWPVFADMVSWNMLAQIFSAINWQIDRILLPRFVDISTFGRYATANDLSALPYQAIAAPIARPLLVAFSDAHQNGTLKETYLKSSQALVWIMAPVFAFMGVMALPVIRLLLGEDWVAAAPVLSALAWISLIALPVIPMAPLAMSLNRTRLVALRTFIEFIIRFPLTIGGVMAFGIAGALAAKAVASIAILFSSFSAVRLMTALSLRVQLKTLVRPLILLLPGTTILYLMLPFINSTSSIPLLGVLIFGAGIAYLCLSVLFSCLIWLVLGKPAGLEEDIMIKALNIVKPWLSAQNRK